MMHMVQMSGQENCGACPVPGGLDWIVIIMPGGLDWIVIIMPGGLDWAWIGLLSSFQVDWIGTIVIPGRSAQPRRVHWSSELWRLSNTRWIGLLSQPDWRKHGCTVITLDSSTTTLV